MIFPDFHSHSRTPSRVVAAGLAAAAITLAALAQPAPAAAELKVGVVITQRLLAESKIGGQAAEKLQGKKKEAQERLDAKANEIADMQQDLAKRAMVLSESEKLKARDQFEQQQRDAQRMKEDLERDLQKSEEEILGGVNRFLSELVVNFGKENGYDLIVDASVAVYFSDEVDVTDKLIAAANAKYK